MLNLNELTIVEKLTFHSFVMRYMSFDYKRIVSGFTDMVGMDRKNMYLDGDVTGDEIFEIQTDSFHLNDIEAKIKKTDAWIHKREWLNHCLKMMWPSVKLPGYTKSKALAEARGVIEFVKSKLEVV